MMNHLVNIQTKTETQNAVTGEVTDSWANTHKNVPCTIEPLSVNTFLQSRADQTETAVRITIPYIDNILPTMRLVGLGLHAGKIYNIEGVLADNITGNEYLTLPCSEGMNEG